MCQLWWPKSHSLSNLTSQTASSASALQSASVSECLGPHPMHLSCQAASVAQVPNGSPQSHHGDLLQCLRVCCTISHHDSNILAAIAHLSVGILYHQTLGNGPSSAHRMWVITFNLTLVSTVFVHVCMILDKKASTALLSLVVTTSSYSVESSNLVVTLSSSNVAVTLWTGKS